MRGIKINLSRVLFTTPGIMNLLLTYFARPRGFEPLTLGLEMQGIGYTNDLVLHRFVI